MSHYAATTAQRELIQKLMEELEIDTKRISLIHKPVFIKAGLWSAADENLSLDGFIYNLTKGDASRLITALQSEIAL